MKFDLQWHKPIPLYDGQRWRMIYCLDDDDEGAIPEAPAASRLASLGKSSH